MNLPNNILQSVLNLTLFCFVCTLIPIVFGHKDGAPVEACTDMRPQHPGTTHQTVASPYKITTSPKALKPTGVLTVSLTVKQKTTFKGFLIQVRGSDNKAIGTFDIQNKSIAAWVDCKGVPKSASVTHRDPKEKTVVNVIWKPPPGLTKKQSEKVNIYYTVVQNVSTYWVMAKQKINFDFPKSGGSKGGSKGGARGGSSIIHVTGRASCLLMTLLLLSLWK